MSRAMVTPSLVTVGAPNFLSSSTWRPAGPRVMATVWESAWAPRRRALRASTSKRSRLGVSKAMRWKPQRGGMASRGGAATGAPRPRPPAGVLVLLAVRDDGEDVLLREDQVLHLVDLDLAARVLGVDDPVTHLDVELDPLAGVLVVATGANRLDHTLLRLLLGGVGQHDAALGDLLALEGLHDDTIGEGTKIHGHWFQTSSGRT